MEWSAPEAVPEAVESMAMEIERVTNPTDTPGTPGDQQAAGGERGPTGEWPVGRCA